MKQFMIAGKHRTLRHLFDFMMQQPRDKVTTLIGGIKLELKDYYNEY